MKYTPPTALTATLLAALLASAPAMANEYVQAEGSTLAFASRYDSELFTGRFEEFNTRLRFNPADPGSGRLEVLIGLTSAVTGNAERDSTLRTAEFFDIGRHAQARYTANGFRKVADDQYVADGTLELRGVSKPVSLTFTWNTDCERPVLSGRAVVQRLDFGVGAGDWADTALIPNAVNISTRVVFERP